MPSPAPFDPALRRRVRDHVARYAKPSTPRAALSLAPTLAVYGLCLAAVPEIAARATLGGTADRIAYGGLCAIALLTLVGTQVRTFMLHHDLCHGSFLANRSLDDALAILVGALVSTSPSVWRREHDRHHKDSNNLDREQDGQTASWTLERYQAAPRWQRILYWLANQRPVLFGLLPPLYFFGFMRVRARLVENLVFGAWVALLVWTERLGWFVLSASLASLFGFLLFHAQHTFDGVHRRPGSEYDFFENGMLGSSYLVLPRWPLVGRVLRWFAYAVEYHHIHHLHPRVPGYHLAACHEDGRALFDAVPRVTLSDALRTTRYSLYAASTGRFTSVGEHSPW
jgi:omega-6 fatty acid desaturase (delta-12 desaturase)